MKKDKKKKIIAIFLIVLLIALASVIVIKIKEKSSPLNNPLVVLNKPKDLSVEYNENDGKVFMIITNNGDDIFSSAITFIFKDEEGTILNKIEKETHLLLNGEQLALFEYLPIDEKYVGNVEVTIEPKYCDTKVNSLDKSLLVFNISNQNDSENNKIKYNIVANNNYGKELSLMGATLVLYKDNKIVNMEDFDFIDVKENGVMEKTIEIENTCQETNCYDLAKVIVNVLY